VAAAIIMACQHSALKGVAGTGPKTMLSRIEVSVVFMQAAGDYKGDGSLD
jgi:hypothetical protein